MVVVGVGARANTGLFDGQLVMENGGIKVNGRMQASDASVYAVGDVAAFPVKLFGGDVRRLEHVDCARRTARHAVAAMLEGTGSVGHIDYLPFFYSRVFSLSWQFYGDNAGKPCTSGTSRRPATATAAPKFGAYWVRDGRVAARSSRAEPAGVQAVAAAVRRGPRWPTSRSSRGEASRSPPRPPAAVASPPAHGTPRWASPRPCPSPPSPAGTAGRRRTCSSETSEKSVPPKQFPPMYYQP